MKKYYIEISDFDNHCEYIMQSRWYDTEEQALEFAKNLSFLDKRYSISLMWAEWDTENDTYYDIEFGRYIDLEIGV